MTTPAAAVYQVLIVDDSAEDRLSCRRYLSQSELPTYEFSEAETVEDGLKCLAESAPDCILLDYRLPDGSGLDFLRRAMSEFLPHQVCVVMLTGYGDEDVIVSAMKQGAMDYVSKGRLSADLLCRAVYRAIEQGELLREVYERQLEKDRLIIELQANAEKKQNYLNRTFKGWELDINTRELKSPGDRRIHLSSAEYFLLLELIDNVGVMTREQLMRRVFNRHWYPDDRYIDVVVAQLRKKFSECDAETTFISTVRGAGYVFVPEVA